MHAVKLLTFTFFCIFLNDVWATHGILDELRKSVELKKTKDQVVKNVQVELTKMQKIYESEKKKKTLPNENLDSLVLTISYLEYLLEKVRASNFCKDVKGRLLFAYDPMNKIGNSSDIPKELQEVTLIGESYCKKL